jgi:hypothetical protein
MPNQTGEPGTARRFLLSFKLRPCPPLPASPVLQPFQALSAQAYRQLNNRKSSKIKD